MHGDLKSMRVLCNVKATSRSGGLDADDCYLDMVFRSSSRRSTHNL